MGIDSLANRRSAERRSPLFSGPIVHKGAPTSMDVTSGTTPVTLTVAQLLTGFLVVDCQDTGTITLPTATLLVNAIPGIAKDDVFDFHVINEGDSTLTVAVGTGITAKVLAASVSPVLTLGTLTSKLFRLVCTAVANPSDPSTSNTFDLYVLDLAAAVLA